MKYTLHNLLGFAPQIAWGGGAIGGASQTTASKETSAKKGKEPTTGLSAIGRNIASDLSIGLSTFGQSKEKQAQTMRDLEYSEPAIKDYQERTAASMARAIAEEKRISKKRGRQAVATTTTTDTDTDTTDTTTTTGTDTVLDQTTDAALDTVEDISTQTFTQTPDLYVGDTTGAPSVGTAAGGVAEYEAAKPTSVGEAEDEALELMKKGRRATILTKPGGLLGAGTEEGQTRRRRSLIGG